MNILMTGKTGLIGSAIYNKLLLDGHNIRTIGRSDDDIKMDLSSFHIFEGLSCDVFIHCAGVTDEEIRYDKMMAIRRGTEKTVELLDWVSNVKPKKIVYISTAHVYGDLNRYIDEDVPTEPISLYAVLHLFVEKYLKTLGLNYLILRPLTGFGDVSDRFSRWDLIPYYFPKALALDSSIQINSHGKQFRHFVSTKTIAEIVSHEIGNDHSKEVNPVGVHTMSVIDYAEYCINLLQSYSKEKLGYVVMQKSDYVNNFSFTSKYNYGEEDENLLKKHVLNIFNKFKQSKDNEREKKK